MVVDKLYLGTSGWYVIYQTLSLFLSRRGWRARLGLHLVDVAFISYNDSYYNCKASLMRHPCDDIFDSYNFFLLLVIASYYYLINVLFLLLLVITFISYNDSRLAAEVDSWIAAMVAYLTLLSVLYSSLTQ